MTTFENFIIPASRFSGGEMFPVLGKYLEDGTTSITLMNAQTGEREHVATVCLAGSGSPETPSGHVWLKGWSENEGVPEALAKSGFVELTDVTAPAGFSEALLAKLTYPGFAA